MKMRVQWLPFVVLLLLASAHAQRHVTELAAGWRFLQADAPHAEESAFNDDPFAATGIRRN